MAITFREAIDRTLQRISLAKGGADVQLYAEPSIKQMIQHKFDVLFDEYWWPQFYNPGETFTLDGTTGEVTANLSSLIKDFKDIRHIYYGTDGNPLPRLNTRINPSIIKMKCFAASNTAGKVFRVFPVTQTGTVTVAFRTKPAEFSADSDVINMDGQLIILGTAYDYVNELGTNPESEAKLLNMFNARLRQLDSFIEHGDASTLAPDVVDTWQEWD